MSKDIDPGAIRFQLRLRDDRPRSNEEYKALESQLKEALEQNAELRKERDYWQEKFKDEYEINNECQSDFNKEIEQLRARLAAFEKVRSFNSLTCRCGTLSAHKDECDITQFNEAIRALDALLLHITARTKETTMNDQIVAKVQELIKFIESQPTVSQNAQLVSRLNNDIAWYRGAFTTQTGNSDQARKMG